MNRLVVVRNAVLAVGTILLLTAGQCPGETGTELENPERGISGGPTSDLFVFGRRTRVESTYDLWRMYSNGTGQRRITNTPSVSEQDPAISPDGTRIAYSTNDGIFVLNTDGSGIVTVAPKGKFDKIGTPAWSADGTLVGFAGSKNGNFDIYTVRADGSGGQKKIVFGSGDQVAPDFSPDGTQVLFLHLGQPGYTDIGIAPADGSGSSTLIDSCPRSSSICVSGPARWSPNGQSFAFLRTEAAADDENFNDNGSNVIIITPGTTTVVKRLGIASDSPVAWSPDGTRIAFIERFQIGETILGDNNIVSILLSDDDTPGTPAIVSCQCRFHLGIDWAQASFAEPLLSVKDASVVEGNAGTRDISFTLELNIPLPEDVRVGYHTEDVVGGANSSDYDSRGGVVPFDHTIPAGQVRSHLTIPVRGDVQLEPNERFKVVIESPVGPPPTGTVNYPGRFGRNTAFGTILDDDKPPPPSPSPKPSVSPSPSPSPSASTPPPVISNGRIAFSSSRTGAVKQIFTMEPDGTDVVHLTSNQATVALDAPSYSADASRVIHTVAGAGGKPDIVDRLAGGSQARSLVTDASNDDDPVYFPGASNGGFIWASDRDGDYELYFSPLTGGTPKKLTDNTFEDRSPSVSGDGKYVVYHSNSDGDFDIYRLEVSSAGDPVGTPENLTAGLPATEQNPDYALTKNKITYQGNTHGDLDIFVLDIDTRQELHVTTDVADETFPTLSPDGAQVAYAKAGDIYVQSATEGAAATNVTNTGNNDKPDWGPKLSSAQSAATSSPGPISFAVAFPAFLIGFAAWRRRRS